MAADMAANAPAQQNPQFDFNVVANALVTLGNQGFAYVQNLAVVHPALVAIQQQLTDVQANMGDLRATVGGIQADMGDLRATVDDLRANMNERFDQVDHRLDQIDTRILAEYALYFDELAVDVDVDDTLEETESDVTLAEELNVVVDDPLEDAESVVTLTEELDVEDEDVAEVDASDADVDDADELDMELVLIEALTAEDVADDDDDSLRPISSEKLPNDAVPACLLSLTLLLDLCLQVIEICEAFAAAGACTASEGKV
ncbi:hypothetical protein DV736_g863, partial [Chaetothyriales sp. CBS 134916]